MFVRSNDNHFELKKHCSNTGSSEIQPIVLFALRCFQSNLHPDIYISSFNRLDSLKEAKRIVYSGVSTVDQKCDVCSLFKKLIDQFKRLAKAPQFLDNIAANNWSFPLTQLRNNRLASSILDCFQQKELKCNLKTGLAQLVPSNLCRLALLGASNSIEKLLKEKPLLINELHESETALDSAVLSGHFTIVSLLWQRGARSFTIDPLFTALSSGNLKMIQFLLSLEESIPLKAETPYLHYAVLLGDKDIVASLLKKGTQSNYLHEGNSPLHLACRFGFVEIVELLLANGANLSELNQNLQTPFLTACCHGQDSVVEYLLAKNPDCGKSPEAFYQICRQGKSKLIQQFLKVGIDISAKNTEGRTPLFAAIESGDFESFQLMLNISDSNTKDNHGESPLMFAIRSQAPVSMIEQLVKKSSVNAAEPLLTQTLKHKNAKEVFSMILDQLTTVKDSQDAKEALLFCLKQGDLANASLILAKGFEVKESLFKKDEDPFVILYKSNKPGTSRSEMADLLRSTGATFSLENLIGTGALSLQELNQFFLTSYLNPSPEFIFKCLVEACRGNSFEIFKDLFSKIGFQRVKEFEKTTGIDLLSVALIGGSDDVIIFLMDLGFPISQEIFNYFCRTGKEQLINKSLDLGFKSKEVRDLNDLISSPRESKANKLAMIQAIIHNWSPELKKLFRQSMQHFLIISVRHNYPLDVIQFIYESGGKKPFTFPQEHLKMALRNGREDIYHFLKNEGMLQPMTLEMKLGTLKNLKKSVSKEFIHEFIGPKMDLQELKKELIAFIPDSIVMEAYDKYPNQPFRLLKALAKLGSSFSVSDEIVMGQSKNITLGRYAWYPKELCNVFFKFLQSNSLEFKKHYPTSLLKLIDCINTYRGILVDENYPKRIKDHKITLVESGYEGIPGHTIGLVLFALPGSKNATALICNRGDGTDYLGLSELNFESNDSMPLSLQRLSRKDSNDPHILKTKPIKTMKNFWKAFEKMGASRKQCFPLVEQDPHFLNKCVPSNMKGALLGVMYACGLFEGKSKEEALKLAKQLYKKFSQFEKVDAVKEGIIALKAYPKNTPFYKSFFSKILNKLRIDETFDESLVKEFNEAYVACSSQK